MQFSLLKGEDPSHTLDYPDTSNSSRAFIGKTINILTGPSSQPNHIFGALLSAFGLPHLQSGRRRWNHLIERLLNITKRKG